MKEIISCKQDSRGQVGFVSLLTAIIISILLSVVVLSMVGLQIVEVRQAEDADQSLKAYYAAESGAEKTILDIRKGVAFGSGCLDASFVIVNPNPGLQTGYSCRQVKIRDNVLTGIAALEQTHQFDLATAPAFDRLELSWNLDGADTNDFSCGAGFPQNRPWPCPAVMEVTVISYPATINPANVTCSNPKSGQANTVCANTLVIKPKSGGSPPPSSSIDDLPSSGSTGNCRVVAGGSNYNCQVNLKNFNKALRYVIRLRPRYNGTHYQLKFFNGPTQVTVPDRVATIDVTGRSGDVVRRVVMKVPIQSQASSGLDYVLYSDTDVCKDFRLSSGVLSGGCVP